MSRGASFGAGDGSAADIVDTGVAGVGVASAGEADIGAAGTVEPGVGGAGIGAESVADVGFTVRPARERERRRAVVLG